MKTIWRTYKGKMPEQLVPLYEILQEELNYVLSNNDIRNKILHEVDYSKHKGDILTQYAKLFGNALQDRPNWDNIANKAWYFRMLAENVRRTYESLQEKYTIYTCLKENNFNIDDQLYATLRSKKIYASAGNFRNIIRQAKNGSVPALPRCQKFVMDYSVSAKQNCLKLDNKTFKLRVGLGTSDEDYVIYHIDLPSSLRLNLTSNCAKPRFYKNNQGNYVADLVYEVKVESNNLDKNVLGVDLGKIKLYSASVLYQDGSVGPENIQSRSLSRMQDKLEKLYSERSFIYCKQERSRGYTSANSKFNSRITHLEGINSKITRIKDHAAKLIANELVELAKANSCDTIVMENLHWLDSTGGKWNHAMIQAKVKEIAELYGIKLELVNCAKSSSTHPVTGEVGKTSNRTVKFSDGSTLDRDHLASVNIATRVKRSHLTPNKINKSTKTPRKFKRTRSHKEVLADMKAYIEAKKNRADTEIVVFAMRSDSVSPHFDVISQTESSSLLQKGGFGSTVCDSFS